MNPFGRFPPRELARRRDSFSSRDCMMESGGERKMRTGARTRFWRLLTLFADAKTAVSPERLQHWSIYLSQPSAAVPPPRSRRPRPTHPVPVPSPFLRLSSPSEDLLAGSERSATSAPAPPLGIQENYGLRLPFAPRGMPGPRGLCGTGCGTCCGTGCGTETALHIGSSSSFQ